MPTYLTNRLLLRYFYSHISFLKHAVFLPRVCCFFTISCVRLYPELLCCAQIEDMYGYGGIPVTQMPFKGIEGGAYICIFFRFFNYLVGIAGFGGSPVRGSPIRPQSAWGTSGPHERPNGIYKETFSFLCFFTMF